MNCYNVDGSLLKGLGGESVIKGKKAKMGDRKAGIDHKAREEPMGKPRDGGRADGQAA